MMTIITIIGAVAFISLCIFPGTYLGTMVVFTHSSDNVIWTFLNVNFTGVKMSKEHIKYVKEINKKM